GETTDHHGDGGGRDRVLQRGDDDLGAALLTAFAKGYLDVPYCLHPDNAGFSRSYIAADGRLCWADIGRMPLKGVADVRPARAITSADLLDSLSYVRRSFDRHDPDDAWPVALPAPRGA
ncbi:hypothetical protein ACWDE9_47155, partial [Streptomyces olivaceoviridis]